jgi:hypothetical protein
MRKYIDRVKRFRVLVLGILAIIVGISIFSIGSVGIEAQGISDTSPIYRPEGIYSWVLDGAYGAHSEGSGTGYRMEHGGNVVAYIQIMNVNQGSFEPLPNGALLSMEEYNIFMYQGSSYQVTSTRFVLKKNGISIVDISNLGTGSIPLFSGALEDGEYGFVYECSYKPNQSSIVCFVYEFAFSVDSTAPAYTLTSNGNNIQSGSYTSGQIKYTVSDPHFRYLWIKAPGQSDFSENLFLEYTVPSSVEGIWRFKGGDSAGNVTEEVFVVYDKTAPVGNIYNEYGNVWSASTYNKKIRYNATDNVLFDRCESKLNNGVWLTYTQGTYLLSPGTYSFRSFDKAGNVSAVKTVIIDITPPSLIFKGDGVQALFGSEVSVQNITASAEDVNGIDKIFVKNPGSETFIEYTPNTQLTNQGKYHFYARDNAGNISGIQNITIDRDPPEISLITGTDELLWGDPTNAGSIRMIAEDTLSTEVIRYVRKPGGNIEVYNGENLYEEGEYMFFARDKAGNTSAEKRVVKDMTVPVIQVLSNIGEEILGEYAKGSIRITGEDNLSGICEIKYKRDGIEAYSSYSEGTLLSGEGEYKILALDNAGNQSEERIVHIDNTLPEYHVFDDFGLEITAQYTNSQYIVFMPCDEGSGVKDIWVRKPGETEYKKYIEGSELTAEGKYWIYIEDNVLNQSEVYSVTVDRTSPFADLSFEGVGYPSGTVSKNDLSCYGIDNIGIVSIYVKNPGEEEYLEYSDRVIVGMEGEYSFYVMDASGNVSGICFFTIDKTPPEGRITSFEENEIEEEYINYGFKYISSDLIKVALMQYIMPGSSMFTKYEGQFFLGGANGQYIFRSIDSAGNISEESSIIFDDTKPALNVFDENGVYANRYSSAEYISPAGEDINGIKNRWVIYPGSEEAEEITAGARFYGEGTYSFGVIDVAGNPSDTLVITLDRSIPVGNIYIDGSLSNSYEYVNKAFYYQARDDHSFVESEYIKKPNSTVWEPYIREQIIFSELIDGVYSFRAMDASGNISEEISLNYDSTVPEGYIYVPKNGIENPIFPEGYERYLGNGFSRSNCVLYYTAEANLDRVEVSLPGSKIYTYSPLGSIYSEEGRYIFRSVDNAGNVSEEKQIILDRTYDYPEVTGLDEEVETGTFSVRAEDGSRLWVNGIEVTSGIEISTVYRGSYLLETEDIAGNRCSRAVEAGYSFGFIELPIKEWFEGEVEGDMYSFVSKQQAIDAIGFEEVNTLIQGYWTTGDVWNTGIMMDPVDSINARPGIYYIYKSASDRNTLSAYFSEARLVEVITAYAEEKIRKYRYFEKIPEREYGGEEVFVGIGAKELILSRVFPIEGLITKVDGVEIEEEYSNSESHTVTYEDIYGNSYSQKIRIISASPKIFLKMGEVPVNQEGLSGFVEGFSSLSPYCFGTPVTIAISEENGGEGYFFLRDEEGNLLEESEKDGRITIGASGIYRISALNRFGNAEDIEVRVSLSSPGVEFVKDQEGKKLHITVRASEDSFADIKEIEIFKSLDGVSYIPVLFDDYGNKVESTRTAYAFRSSGTYRVSILDSFRNGKDIVNKEISYVKPYPEGVLSGVSEGQITNGSVTFSWTDEAEANIQRSGFVKERYEKGREIEGDGEYTIFLSDFDNNITEYSFQIKTTPPALSITGVENGGITNSPVVISALDQVSCMALRNGEAFSYTPGESLDIPGMYELHFVDLAGNESTYTFEISEKEKSNIYIYFIIAFGVGAVFIAIIIIRRRTGFRRTGRSKR